ncbi:MAG: LuxR family transcriptional regulator [Gemmobacter sp.]|nr:LuxR family transcriptional regulator [Gemmobacter sp.]
MRTTSQSMLALRDEISPGPVAVAATQEIGYLTNALYHLQRIANAQTPEEVWAMHLAAMAEYGFTRVIYGFTRQKRENSLGDIQDALFLSNHDRGMTHDYFDAGFFMKTPMFHWVLANTGACSWQWAETERAAGRLSAEELMAMDMTRRAGITAGYSISFAEVSPREKGGMGLTAHPGLTQQDVDELWQVHGDEVQAICNMMHLRITHMPFRIQRRSLSPRQREALEWVAEGKTTQDIAQIMAISSAMVEKHLRLAREVLDVETTAHAVAKAAMLNHIFSGALTAVQETPRG